MARFMVTGGAGFIGSHTVESILSEGHEVVIYDNFSTGRECNLSGFCDRVEIIRADVRDKDTLLQAMAGVEHVIHLAAEISVVKSLEEPDFIFDVNVGGTLNVLMAAQKNGVKRVVLASSSAVYGDTGMTPQHEGMLPNPISPYGASKMSAEHCLSCFYHLHSLETVRLRYFNVFGPRQNPKSQYAAVIPKFVDRLLEGKELHIYGDGEQTRDFVFVGDVARANYLSCTSDAAPGEVFNISSGRSISVNDLAKTLMDVTGSQVDVVHEEPVSGEIKYSISDSTKTRKVFGFTSRVRLEEGLKQVVDYAGTEMNR